MKGNQRVFAVVGAGLVVLIMVLLVVIVAYNASQTALPADTETVANTTETEAAPEEAAESTEADDPPANAANDAFAPTVQIDATVMVETLNMRGGPGTNYPVVGQLSQDETFTIIGKNAAETWFVVRAADVAEAWIINNPDFISLSDDTAIAELAVTENPPLPYDTSNPAVNRVLNEVPLVIFDQSGFRCASHGGLNFLLPQVVPGNVIGPHAGEFMLVSNNKNVVFIYQGGNSFELTHENDAERFAGGVKSLPFSEAMNMFARGEIIWTGSLGQAPGRGVPGCDPQVP